MDARDFRLMTGGPPPILLLCTQARMYSEVTAHFQEEATKVLGGMGKTVELMMRSNDPRDVAIWFFKWYLPSMGRKQVLVQLDDELIEALDQAANAEGTNRSDVIRRAARAWLVARQEVRWDREHEAAYARAPEDPELIESLTRMAARALAAEEPPPYRA